MVFERIIAEHPETTFINASEQGLRLAGAQHMPLDAALTLAIQGRPPTLQGLADTNETARPCYQDQVIRANNGLSRSGGDFVPLRIGEIGFASPGRIRTYDGYVHKYLDG